ncbi:hypothetical protein HDU99_002404, partial [Rhizoclosmatium hyalinum]
DLQVRVQIMLRTGEILKTTTLSHLDASVERISWLINTYLAQETEGQLVGDLERLAIGTVAIDFKDKNVLEQQIDSFVKVAARGDGDGVARSLSLVAVYWKGHEPVYGWEDSSGACMEFLGKTYNVSIRTKVDTIPAIVGLRVGEGFNIIHEESGEQIDIDDNNPQRFGMTLQELGLESRERYILSPILSSGGGIGPSFTAFVDVSNGGPSKIEFASEAPRWRVVSTGLNLEGVCTNKSCNAFGDLVIAPQGLGVFDLEMDAHRVQCPECDKRVVPKKCGFYDCEYAFTGFKSVDGNLVGH